MDQDDRPPNLVERKFMKFILLALLLSGCATQTVHVKHDSCKSMGIVYGVAIDDCEVVKLK
jgi:hypothetical protein